MTQKMDAQHVYDLDDLKKFKESGASAEEVREAYAMMAENKKRREKATKELLNLDWETVSLDQVKDWVEQGADVNAKGLYGVTPLRQASEYGHQDVVKYLVEHGADLRAKDAWGCTPFHWASGKGYLDVIKYLVERGADVKAKDKYGNTPLHRASRNGHLNVVEYLIAHGADVNAKDAWGYTPLHRTSENGHLDVVKCLIEHGADEKVEDKDGKTPLHRAEQKGYTKIVEYFAEQEHLLQQRFEKAKEIRLVDADHAGQPVDHSLRRMLFGGKQLRQDAPLSPIVAERFRKRQDRS